MPDWLAILKAYLDTLVNAMGLTTFGQRTVIATDVNGVTWKDLLDMSTITKQEEIWGILLTVAGGWAGKCQIRIVRADTAIKIFPFGPYAEEDAVPPTDFFISGVEWSFPAPIVVPITQGYKIQFRSTVAGDGAGKTLELTQLNMVQRG